MTTSNSGNWIKGSNDQKKKVMTDEDIGELEDIKEGLKKITMSVYRSGAVLEKAAKKLGEFKLKGETP